ncbi:MAG: hypothetical protein ACJZ86_03690 [Pontiellaceae bacterium]
MADPTARLLPRLSHTKPPPLYLLPSSKKGRYQISLSEPLFPPPYQSKPTQDIINNLAQTITDHVSKTILKNPHTWIWSYPYWQKYARYLPNKPSTKKLGLFQPDLYLYATFGGRLCRISTASKSA